MNIQDFIQWLSGYRECNKTQAVEIAAQQLGVKPLAVWTWLRGENPSKTAQILMRLIVQRGHLVEEPDLSPTPHMMELAKQYARIIHWSAEDGCYIGSLPDFNGNCCHGNTPEEVALHLEEVLDLLLADYIEDNTPAPDVTFKLDALGKVAR